MNDKKEDQTCAFHGGLERLTEKNDQRFFLILIVMLINTFLSGYSSALKMLELLKII